MTSRRRAWGEDAHLPPAAIDSLTALVPGLSLPPSGSGAPPALTVQGAARAVASLLPAAGPRVALYVSAALQAATTAGTSTRAAAAPGPAAHPFSLEALAAEAACAPHCQAVAEGVYLGSHMAATSPKALAACGITAVLNCTPYAFEYPPCVRASLSVHVDQASYARGAMAQAVGAVQAWLSSGQHHAVLIHCIEGRFRSATVAAAVLMQPPTCLGADAAVAAVRLARPWARPKRFALRALELRGPLLPAPLTRELSAETGTPGQAATAE
jgi:hypothetical protein